MKTLSKKSLIVLALLAAGSSLAQAQSAAAPAATATPARHALAKATPEQRQAAMAEHFAAATTRLHDALKLSRAQEPAWADYVAAIKPAAPAAHPDRAAIAAMSGPEREALKISMEKKMLAAREARLPALTALYAVLDADQKATLEKAQHRMAGAMQHARMGRQHQNQT